MVIIVLLVSLYQIVECMSNEINIDLNNPNTRIKPFPQLWTSTGFCPPDPHQDFRNYISLNAVKDNIGMIGSLPYNNQTFQIRIHWLLNLVTVTPGGTYDFTYLDQLVNLCTGHGLSMGFELMGNPSNYFSDFENNTQVNMWYKLIYQTVERYAHIHYNWNYEMWNEPDHHKTFEGLNMTLKGYLNYIDACERGVHEADSKTKFGGPGASCRLTKFSQYCWAAIDHIVNGVNYFTKENGTRVDFISFHKKGGDRGSQGHSSVIYVDELQTIRQIQTKYKKLSNLRMYNDEGDPLKGWDYPMTFHATLQYPAMITRVIHMHLYSDDKEFSNYQMTSNDNAFLSIAPNYFTQRTLLASMSVNESGTSHAVLILKPVYELMTVLAQVRGDVMTPPNLRNDMNETVGCLCTSAEQQLMVTCWASNDTNNYTAGSTDVYIQIPSHMIGGDYIIRELTQISTYDIWRSMGSPDNLTHHQLELLWNTSMILTTQPKKVGPNIKLTVSGPGVAQLLVCHKQENLTMPHSLTFRAVTQRAVVISWSDDQISDCFLTYQLEIRRSPKEAFITINERKLLSRSYQFTSSYGVSGEYRIRSKNIAGQVSAYSPIYKYPG